jgi:hypothetical protein
MEGFIGATGGLVARDQFSREFVAISNGYIK